MMPVKKRTRAWVAITDACITIASYTMKPSKFWAWIGTCSISYPDAPFTCNITAAPSRPICPHSINLKKINEGILNTELNESALS